MAVYLNGFQNVAMHQFAIDSLSGTFSQAAEINDVSVMETIVVTMGCVGKVSKGRSIGWDVRFMWAWLVCFFSVFSWQKSMLKYQISFVQLT